MEDLVERFVKVFRGRGDVYGSAKGFCVHEALTGDVYRKHLEAETQKDWIGVYCMINTFTSYGCIDIDGKDFNIGSWQPCDNCYETDEHTCHVDGEEYGPWFQDEWDWEAMLNLANNLVIVLGVKDIVAHIERTKNGYHVWVFPETPLVPAATMRRALMAACVALNYNPKEVNPKSEGPRPGTKGYGNFVRLPYGSALHNVEKVERFLVEPGDSPDRMNLEEALYRIENSRTPTENLEAVAKLWTPPPVPTHEVDYDAGLDVANVLHLVDGKSYTIWKDGPLPGSDRSSTLVRLTHLLIERGLTATQTYAVVNSADKRWGKYNDQGRPEELAHIIEGAYLQHE